MSEARVQCYAMLRCCRPPVCGHPDTCFCVPLVARAAAGGAAAAAGGRGGGVSRPGGGGAGEGILTTKSKFMKEIDGRTEIDQAFTVKILTWLCCRVSLPAPFCQEEKISPCTPLPGGEYLPLHPSARRRISPPAPLCQEENISPCSPLPGGGPITFNKTKRRPPGQARPPRCCRLPSAPSRSQDTLHSSFFTMF